MGEPRRAPGVEMRVALAQINTTVGDLAGNEARILAAYQRGVDAGAELVVFPELAVTGYPPRDLLLRPDFVRRNLEVLDRLAGATGPTGMLVGYVGRNEARPGRRVDQCGGFAAIGEDSIGENQDSPADLRCLRRRPLLRAGGG